MQNHFLLKCFLFSEKVWVVVVPFSNFGIGAVSTKFFAILLLFFVVRYSGIYYLIIFLCWKSLYYIIVLITFDNRRSNRTLMKFHFESVKVIYLGAFLIRSQNTNLKASAMDEVKNHLVMKFLLRKGKNEDVLIHQKHSLKHWPRLNHLLFLAQVIGGEKPYA